MLLNLGSLYESEGNTEEAAKYFLEAVEAGSRKAIANYARLTKTVAVQITFSGERAAQNLAATYRVLRSKYPELLFDKDNTKYLPKDKGFFRQAIDHQIWPRDAWQLIEFAEALKVGDQYVLPDTKVETLLVNELVRLPDGWGDTLSANQQAEVCFKNGWIHLRQPGKAKANDWIRKTSELIALNPKATCVIKVIPPRELYGVKSNGWIAIKRNAFVFRLKRFVERPQALTVQQEILSSLRENSPKGAFAATRFEILPFAVDPMLLTNETELKIVPPSLHHLLKWPEKLTPSRRALQTIIVDPSVVESLRCIESNQPIGISSEVGDAISLDPLRHPMLSLRRKAKLSHINLTDILAAPTSLSSGNMEHAIAVAGVIHGAPVNIINGDGTENKISGLLPYWERSRITFCRPNQWFVNLDEEGGGKDEGVIVEPYNEGHAVNPDSLIANAYQSLQKDVISVVSAPLKSTIIKQSDSVSSVAGVPRINGFERYEHGTADKVPKTCDTWPACLGAFPYAVVVAALDSTGASLFEQDKYMLGSKMIWLAAPGQRIVTAGYEAGKPIYRSWDGSSFAAPIVGALALALKAKNENLYGMEIIGRIAGTADLDSLDPDLIRFGPINVVRALVGSDVSKDAVWSLSDDQTTVRYENITPNGPELCAYEPGVKYNISARAKPTCFETRNLLRVSRAKKQGEDSFDFDDKGNPLFNIVYVQIVAHLPKNQNSEYFQLFQSPVPEIRRKVLLNTNEFRQETRCSVDGSKTFIVDQGKKKPIPPCLKSSRGGINLLTDYVVFHPTKSRPN